MKKDKSPVVLLCASRWYALSARLAMAFIRHGTSVSVLCPRGHPVRLVPGVQKFYRYHGLNSLGSLKAAIMSALPEIIVPCDDGVVLQLHALWKQEPSLVALIENSLGKSDAYPIVDSRIRLLQTAADLGICVPRTQAIESAEELTGWAGASAVLKTDGSMGGEGTAIAHTPAEISDSYERLKKPISAMTALKRTVINRRPLSIWGWQRAGQPTVTVQEFISGTPANTMIACWRGEMLASVTVEVLSSQGATGAATVVRLIRHREIEEASCKLARRLRLTGFYGLDFILKRSSDDAAGGGAAYLIEMNPRSTQLGHLSLQGQGDLAGILGARLGTEPMLPRAGTFDCTEGDLLEGETIALFPQALFSNPNSPYLRHGRHDVPWESPQLVRELLLEEWPARQPLARVYHLFRKPVLSGEEHFEVALDVPVHHKSGD